MLRRVPAEADPDAAAVGGASAAAALELQRPRPRRAERRRRCRLSLNGQVVEAPPAGFGPTTEAVAAARTVANQAALGDPPPADSPLRNADEIRGQIGVVERGSVSFVEKARRLQRYAPPSCWRAERLGHTRAILRWVWSGVLALAASLYQSCACGAPRRSS
jgi:hypothetical protein